MASIDDLKALALANGISLAQQILKTRTELNVTENITLARKANIALEDQMLAEGLEHVLYVKANIGDNQYDFGGILRYDIIADELSTIYKFTQTGIAVGLWLAANMKIFVLFSDGYNSGSGAIGSYDLINNSFTLIKEFGGVNDPIYPIGAVLASNGLLYCLSTDGGVNAFGTFFSINTNTNAYTLIREFDGTNDGSFPGCSPIIAANGLIYGTCQGGGANDTGTIWSYNIGTSTFTKLQNFPSGTTVRIPVNKLTQHSNGKLYGIGTSTSANNAIYVYDIGLNTITRTVNLNSLTTYGRVPPGAMVEAYNGKLYGVMTSGGTTGSRGVLFEYNPIGDVYTKKYEFNINSDNRLTDPASELKLSADRKILYGSCSLGGLSVSSGSGFGGLFEYHVEDNRFDMLEVLGHDKLGFHPRDNMIFYNADNKVYFLTKEGYSIDKQAGAVCYYDITTGKIAAEETIRSWSTSNLTEIVDNKSYLVSISGGLTSIHEFDTVTKRMVLAATISTPSGNSTSYVTIASNNKLYFAVGGTSFSYFIEFEPTTKTVAIKQTISGADDGSMYSLRFTETNNKTFLYTKYDNKIYEYDYVFNIIKPFKISFSSFGTFNARGLERHGENYFFSTFSGGTPAGGVIMKYHYPTNTLIKIINLGSYGIGGGSSNLKLCDNGKMYGETKGTSGAIFEFDPITYYFRVLKIFNPNDSEGNISNAYFGGVVINNFLYGFTEFGGSSNNGVFFKFDLVNGVYTILKHFEGFNNFSELSGEMILSTV